MRGIERKIHKNRKKIEIREFHLNFFSTTLTPYINLNNIQLACPIFTQLKYFFDYIEFSRISGYASGAIYQLSLHYCTLLHNYSCFLFVDKIYFLSLTPSFLLSLYFHTIYRILSQYVS